MEGTALPGGAEEAGPGSEAELVAQVERALYQLYSDPEPSNKTAADQWLQALQQSPQAWSLSWILLQHQTLEAKNFGALMLRNKINKGWCELPPEQHNILRVELFKHLASSSSGHALVLSQLCRALVGVAFQTMPEQWPNTVVSCIHSLKKACQEFQGADFPSAVIQLLTSFPQEFEVSPLRKGSIKNELTSGLQSVLVVMEEVILKAQSKATKNKAIRCCNSWLVIGASLPEMTSLIDLLFGCLSDPELMESASDMLYELVVHDHSYKYPAALRKFLQRVLELRALVRKSLEDDDMEACLSLVKLVQGTATSNTHFLTSLSEESSEDDCDDALAIVQLVLEFLCVSGSPPVDEKCSQDTLQFFGNFLDQISMDSDQCKFLLEFYSAQLSTLIEVLPQKAQYPPDEEWEESWSDDDRDDFVKYREDLCDLGEYLQVTMHVEYLQHLSSRFSDHLSTPQPPTWQSVEAILYLLQGVVSNVTQQGSTQVQTVLSLFPRLPPHPTLVKTALSLLGFLSVWFKHHPSLLQGVIPMILGGLGQPALAASACMAFRDVCMECATPLSAVADQLVLHCQQGLSSPHLSSCDCVRLVAAIGGVLSTLPLSDLVGPLESLVASRVDRLQTLAGGEPSSEVKVQVEKELDVLGALCHHIYPDLKEGERHPVVPLLIQLFPAVQLLITKWCMDHSVVEGICVVLNRAMRTVHRQYLPLLEDTIELVIKCYATVQHHKLLESAAQVVEVFGKDETCSSLLTALLVPLHSLSLQLFQSAMSEHPDVVQAYLGLNTTILRTNHTLLLSCDGNMNSFYDIGLAALKLPERPTVEASSSFFLAFIGLATSVVGVAEVLQVKGRLLVQYILEAIAGAASRSYLPSFSDILDALLSHCMTLLSQWLNELLAQDGFPSSNLTPEEKERFKAVIFRGRGQQKKIMRKNISEFSLKCRGFHGSMYPSDTIYAPPP